MANEWLRLWHDMPNDPKWRTISRISGQPIMLIIAVYTHLLVDASRNVTRGHIDVTTEDLASALDVTEEQIEAVLSAMEGRVKHGNALTGWEKRQPKKEDQGDKETGAMSSKERKRLQRHRDKLRDTIVELENDVTISHDESRNVTTDKDKDKDKDINTTTPVRARDEKFAMFPDWKPSEQFHDVVRMSGMKMPDDDELNAIIAEFVAYWLTKEIQRSQNEWEHKLVSSIKFYNVTGGVPREKSERTRNKGFSVGDAVGEEWLADQRKKRAPSPR